MKTAKSLVKVVAVSLGLGCLLLAPEVQACATCFGQTDSPLGKGLNWGILSLLVVVGMVLAAISSFFVFIVRRSARVEREDAAGNVNGSTSVEHVQEFKASKNQES